MVLKNLKKYVDDLICEDKSRGARTLFYASLDNVCTEARKDFEDALTKTLERKS